MNEDRFTEGLLVGQNGYGNNGMFGNDGAWWIILLLLAGWGNYGGFGGGFGGNAGFNSFELGRLATTTDVASGFNNSAVLNSLNDLKLGQAGLQQTLCQGFNGINTSILTSTNDISRQIGDCCCQTQRAIDGVNFNISKGLCDVIRAGQDNAQRIVDFLTNDKIETLNRELTLAQGQLSQNAQTRTLIDTLRPVAQPAYITCSPYESTYGFNRGCGCGC